MKISRFLIIGFLILSANLKAADPVDNPPADPKVSFFAKIKEKSWACVCVPFVTGKNVVDKISKLSNKKKALIGLAATVTVAGIMYAIYKCNAEKEDNDEEILAPSDN